MTTLTGGELVRRLATHLASRRAPATVRVAVDGPDAAGKTTLADELARALSGLRRPAIRLSIDGFHRPEKERRRRGSLSPEGYFLDSFDYDALRRLALDPLGPGGDGRYRRAIFDFRRDAIRDEPGELAPPRAVLVFDGVFLLRDELRGCWEFTIFVDVSPEESLRRALARDRQLFGSEEAIRERYLRRYLPGQELYRSVAHPEDLADVVVDNRNPEMPTVLKWLERFSEEDE